MLQPHLTPLALVVYRGEPWTFADLSLAYQFAACVGLTEADVHTQLPDRSTLPHSIQVTLASRETNVLLQRCGLYAAPPTHPH